MRRKALQAVVALCKHAPHGPHPPHAAAAAKQLADAVLPHLLAHLSAPPDSPLAQDDARQVSISVSMSVCCLSRLVTSNACQAG